MKDNKLEELRLRTKKTTMSRYRASERLERHHKLSQWTVSLLSVGLVFIPIMQALNVRLGIEALYLNAIQSVLAVLVLAYSLLLGQENFISRSEAMHRNGIELGRFSRKLIAYSDEHISEDEYLSFVNEYYNILDKYENHKPIDYLITQLHFKPQSKKGCFIYCLLWIKAQLLSLISYWHYVLVLSFVFFIFYKVFTSIFGFNT